MMKSWVTQLVRFDEIWKHIGYNRAKVGYGRRISPRGIGEIHVMLYKPMTSIASLGDVTGCHMTRRV